MVHTRAPVRINVRGKIEIPIPEIAGFVASNEPCAEDMAQESTTPLKPACSINNSALLPSPGFIRIFIGMQMQVQKRTVQETS